jgi:copper chaperone CopZ
MKIKPITVLVALFLSTTMAWSAPSQKILKPGAYTAHVKGMVCSMCKDTVEETIRKTPGIESASVDAKASMVNFKVQTGKTIDLTRLQEALKASSQQMGMGADYALSQVKPLKKT